MSSASSLPPRPVPWDQLAWLEIPIATRRQWVLAPDGLTWSEAEDWARAWVKAERGCGRWFCESTWLSSGDTLIKLYPPPLLDDDDDDD